MFSNSINQSLRALHCNAHLFNLHFLFILLLFMLFLPASSWAYSVVGRADFVGNTEADITFGIQADSPTEESQIRYCVRSELYRGDKFITSYGYGTTTITDTGLVKGQQYTYIVKSYSSCPNNKSWAEGNSTAVGITAGRVNGTINRPMTVADEWKIYSVLAIKKPLTVLPNGSLVGNSSNGDVIIYEGGELIINGGTLQNSRINFENGGKFSSEGSTLKNIIFGRSSSAPPSAKFTITKFAKNNFIDGFTMYDNFYILSDFEGNTGVAEIIKLYPTGNFAMKDNNIPNVAVTILPTDSTNSIVVQNNTIKQLTIGRKEEFKPINTLHITKNTLSEYIKLWLTKDQPFTISKNIASSIQIASEAITFSNDTRTFTQKSNPSDYNRVIKQNTLYPFYSSDYQLLFNEIAFKFGEPGSVASIGYPADNILVSDNIVRCQHPPYGQVYGAHLRYGSSGNMILDNTFDNCSYGVYLYGFEHRIQKNIIKGNSIVFSTPISNYWDGVSLLKDTTDNLIENNIISGYDIGVRFQGIVNNPPRLNMLVVDNIFRGNTVQDSRIGIMIELQAKNNKIYNNIIKARTTGYSSLISAQYCEDATCPNEFNLPQLQDGMNVVGGPKIGGNYWSTYTGVDNNKDGIGDTAYQAQLWPDGKSYLVKDDFPLLLPALRIIEGPMNPAKNAVLVKGQPANVLHIKIENNERTSKDITLEKLTFNFAGNGKAADVTNVYLFKDSACSGAVGETPLRSGAFTGASIIFDGLNEVITKAAPVCYMLRYTLQTPVPCGDYGAMTTAAGAKAKITADSSDVQVGGMATGKLNMGYPEIELEQPLQRAGVVKKAMTNPLSATLKEVDAEDAANWRAKYTYTQYPNGAVGYNFDSEGTERLAQYNAQTRAMSTPTLGDKIGLYKVGIVPEIASANYQCPDTMPTEKIYDVYAAGIELTAQNNGSQGDVFGTYILGIKAKNKFTAVPKLAPGDTRTVQKVTFKIGSTVKEDATEPYEAEFDMAEASETITVTALLSDNSVVEQEYPIKTLSVPGWFNVVSTIVKSIESKFEDEQDRYRITFTYPTDFIWSNPIPSWVPVLGAEEQEANFIATIGADYYLNQNTGFYGSAEFKGEILSKEFTVKGEIEGQFDTAFNLLPGTTGTVYGEINFPLPEKTLASKTIVVYGVPITIAMDVGGNFKIFANAALILDEKLRFSKLTFAPGTTLQLDLTASATAAFGVAKLGVKGSPTATLVIRLSYTTAEGIKQEAFGGKVEIPITVFGSLFWDTFNGELCDPFVIGPYTFGTGIEGLSEADNEGAQSSGLTAMTVSIEPTLQPMATNQKNYYSTSSIAASGLRKVRVYTKDISTEATAVNPEIYAQLSSTDGSTWFTETRLTTNTLWEMDPDVTFLSDATKALAIWTVNKLDKNTVNKTLHDIFRNQDIAYSYYNGSTWSAAANIINDNYSDGNARVAFDNLTNKAMAVWVHNVNNTNTMDTKSRQIYYSIFDAGATTPSWSTPQALAATTDSTSNYMPVVASDNNGNFHIAWVKDIDGNLFNIPDNNTDNWTTSNNNNTDSDVYHTIYNVATAQFSEPVKVTITDNATELMPSIAINGTEAIISYVKRQGQVDRLYLTKSTNYQTHELLDTGEYLIEDPRLNIIPGKAIVSYRKHNGTTDEIYTAQKDLSTGQTTIRQITHTGTLKHAYAGAVAADGTIVSTWTSIQSLTPPSIGMAEAVEGRVSIRDNESSVMLYQIRNDAVDGIDFYQNINVLKAGKYVLKADLYDSTGKTFITKAEGETLSQPVNAGQIQSLRAIFPGREINASGINGPYKIKNITVLEKSNLAVEVARHSAEILTPAYQANIFRASRIKLDRQIYTDTNSTMKITVEDENISGQAVTVKLYTSANAIAKEVTINGANGIFTKDITLVTTTGGVDTLQVANGAALRATYTDTTGKQWNAAAGWIIGPKSLNIRFAGNGRGIIRTPSGQCQDNCTLLFSSGQGITLTAIAASDSYIESWGVTTCQEGQDNCTIMMDTNKEITVTFSKLPAGLHKMNLTSGWNFISLPVQPDNETIQGIFKDKLNQTKIIWGYDNILKWRQHRPSLASTLQNMQAGKGYWIYMLSPQSIYVVGTPVNEWTLPTGAGWHLIGWTGQDNASVVEVMNQYAGQWDIIWGWESGQWSAKGATTQTQQTVNVSELQRLYRGRAYWIKVR